MDYKKAAVLLAACFLAYMFLYRPAEIDYGQFTGASESAPRLTGKEVVGRLLIYLPTQSYSAGHGFVLNANSRKYVVSASHVISGSFKNVDSVDVMSGKTAVVANAKPAFGPSYSTCKMGDARSDVTFYTTDSVPGGGDIALGAAPPQAGQNVWLLCTQDGAKKELIPAVVTSSSNRALQYKFLSAVGFNGTSGCPVVNSAKQLVGVNVCGHAQAGVAVPIPTILDSLDAI
jgi:S1-C subfamily serine protease